MNRLVYLVITFLNPFGKLYVVTAAQQEAVQAQSLFQLPPAASAPCKCTAVKEQHPLCASTAPRATLVSTLL